MTRLLLDVLLAAIVIGLVYYIAWNRGYRAALPSDEGNPQ